MSGPFQTVLATKEPQQLNIQLAQGDTFLLVNTDVINAANIGNYRGSQDIPVPPLGSITLSSTREIWVSSPATAALLVLPGGSNWTPSPAQVAAQISALGLATASNQGTQIGQATTGNTNTGNTVTNTGTTATNVANLTTGGNPGGIPHLRGTDNFGTATGQTIATGVNAILINGTAITKPGFEAVFQLNIPAAAGTVPFAILQVLWQDSATGLQVGSKQYVLTSGNGPANVLTYYLSGPCRGNQIVLKLRNQDPAQTLTVTWAFNQTSHTYLVDRLLQPFYAATAPITFTNPNGNPSKGLLFSSSPAIGPNANVSRLCAASNSKVKVMLDNTVQLNPAAVQINTPITPGQYEEAAAPTVLFKTTAAAGGQGGGEWQMPNGAVVIQIFNQAVTNTITPNVNITLMEY